jgi:hypothetical protein
MRLRKARGFAALVLGLGTIPIALEKSSNPGDNAAAVSDRKIIDL